jgi:hypothetical protein
MGMIWDQNRQFVNLRAIRVCGSSPVFNAHGEPTKCRRYGHLIRVVRVFLGFHSFFQGQPSRLWLAVSLAWRYSAEESGEPRSGSVSFTQAGAGEKE